MLHLIYTVILFTAIAAKNFPPNIMRCSKSDPNINGCMDKAVSEATRKIAGGNSALGIPPLEPFSIKKIDLGNTTSGAVSLTQVYENMDIYNMTVASVHDSELSLDDNNCYWNFKTTTPFVRMTAIYTMKGQVLIFPINGHGKCEIVMYDIANSCKAKCEKYVKNGEKHIRITGFSMKMVPGKIVFDFDNVIDGNKEFTKHVVDTLNEQSKEVYADVGPGFDQAMSIIWMQTINGVLSKFPEDELFLP